MSTFDRDAIQAFRFVRCGFDADSRVAELAYAFDDGPELVETITVPGAPFALTDDNILHLTRDFALYGYAAFTLNDAKGIVKVQVG